MESLKHACKKGIDKVPVKAKKSVATNEVKDSNKRKMVKFEVHGEELIEKKVKASGNSGRVYLPPGWIGHSVKIIRID
jgi:putative transposon-encoded protein